MYIIIYLNLVQIKMAARVYGLSYIANGRW